MKEALEHSKVTFELILKTWIITGKQRLDIQSNIDYLNEQLRIAVVVKSLPRDNFCIVCNLPTDGEKCYSKRCPV